MPKALSVKMLGLPRWAWLAILAGGLTIGLILRSRQSEDEEIVEEDAASAVGPYVSSDLEAQGLSDGYIGDPGYVLTPVAQSPTETIVIDRTGDDFGDLGGFITDPMDAFGDFDPPGPVEPDTLPPGQGDINVNVTLDPGVARNCKKRPKRKPPKGYQWRCIGNRWAAVPRKRQGGGKGPDRQDGAGGKPKRRPQERSAKRTPMPRVTAPTPVEVVTGGGPPPRPNIHGRARTPSRRKRQPQPRRR